MTFDQSKFDRYEGSNSPRLQAFHQGYTGLPLTAVDRGSELIHQSVEAHYFDGLTQRLEDGYLESVIEAATERALEHLEIVVLEQTYIHEQNIEARGGNELLIDLQRTVHMNGLKRELADA